MALPVLLLVATLALLFWFAKDDVREYRLFKALDRSSGRRARYALWVVKQVAFFALPALVGLALLGRIGALTAFPPEFAAIAMSLGPPVGIGDDILGVLVGAAIGGALAGGVTLWLIRRRRVVRDGATGRLPTLGDIDHLLPRNRAELPYGAMLAVSAGLTEELAFRLYLPLLLAMVTGNGWVAVVVPVLIFGALHRYQGWVGVVATTVMGVLFTLLYLYTRSLAVAIAGHAILDLNALVLRPAIAGAWHRAPAD